MTITEIGRSIGLNRNSCAKYLDILHVNGQVEMKKDGNAKVFHLSHRVPIQALLNFSSDLIIILDHSLTIVEANDNLISMFKFKKEMMIDSKLANTGIPFFSEKGRLKLLRDAVRGKESKFETSVKLGDRPKHFKVRLIPSALGDGESGVTIIMENITNQKLAQKRIIESEERFRAIFNSSPDAIMMIKDNVFIYCNASTLKTFGANDYGEIYGLTPADLSPQFQLNGERTADSYRSYLKETMEIGYKDLEWIHRRKDGSEFHASVRLNRVEIGGEKLIQATVRDISDIISVQNELRSKESRLRNIASSLHGTFIGLLRRDLVFEEFWGTEELDKKYGIEDSSDLRGMSILEFTSKENHIEMKDRIEKCFRTGKPFMIEHQAELPNGRFWQEWSFSPYRNDLGNIEFLVKFGVDTQERNEMLRSLKKGEARFRNILSSLYNSFIGLINREYCFEEFWSSRELDNSYGITSSDMIGERITRFSPPEHEDDLIEIVDRVFQTGVPVTMEVPGKLPSGTYWQVMTLSPYRNEKGEVEYVIMYGIDSTEKHDLFEKLKRTEEKYNILDSNSSDVIWMTDRDM
ncbi:MAG: PAS domain S-box protein, partial [Candidatus Thermoplasmatota archaeon]|nr:PAS domain S-box protein [Candidatus Thermoplasmatota archaeon]